LGFVEKLFVVSEHFPLNLKVSFIKHLRVEEQACTLLSIWKGE